MSDPYAPDQPPPYGQPPSDGTAAGADPHSTAYSSPDPSSMGQGGADPYAPAPYASDDAYAQHPSAAPQQVPGGYGAGPQAGYGPGGYAQAPYQGVPAAPPRTPEPLRSQIINSAIGVLVVGFLCGGTIPAILGIIALTQVDSNPQSAQTLNKVGWILCIVFAVLIIGTMLVSFVLPVLLSILFGAAAMSSY